MLSRRAAKPTRPWLRRPRSSDSAPSGGLLAGHALGAAGTLRGVPVQLAAVLPGREIEPAPAGAEEAALVGEAEQVGRLREREVEPTEVLLGQLATRVVKQLEEGGRLLLEASLQRALAHAQLAGDLVAPRLAIGQPADNHVPRPVAGLRMVEMLEVFAGEALVQLGEQRVGRGQRHG